MMRTIYVHYKNHKAYQKVPGEYMIQENDVWVPAVLYQALDEPKLRFMRTVTEFNQKFIETEIPFETKYREPPSFTEVGL